MASERQMVTRYEDASENHRLRYEWAARILRLERPLRVLDFACGCGYGTALLADALPDSVVIGYDRDGGAIAHAQQYFQRDNTLYICGTYTDLPADQHDAVVCFETLEHIEQDVDFLAALAMSMTARGLLLLSVPNEQYCPHDPAVNPFHFRHYRPMELENMLTDAGLAVTGWARQLGSLPGECEVYDYSGDGLCILVIARKP